MSNSCYETRPMGANRAHRDLAAHIRRKVELQMRHALIDGRSETHIADAHRHLEIACRAALDGDVQRAWRRF